MSARHSFALRFYLGLGAPCSRANFTDLRVRAASGYKPALIRDLIALFHKESDNGSLEPVNFRCAVVTFASDERRFFVKEFPHNRPLHGLETKIRCSRADRAWRAAHLLQAYEFLTPRAVGSALADKQKCEYLITEWLAEAMPFHQRLRQITARDERLTRLTKFARFLRQQHDLGLYLRDLITNVLTRETDTEWEFWLTDLDQLHPIRRLTRKRILRQMSQLARWTGRLTEWEAGAIISTCFGRIQDRYYEQLESVLLNTPSGEC